MNTANIVSVITRGGELKIENSLTKDATPIYISGRRTAWKEQLIKALSRYCGCSFTTEKDSTGKNTQYYLVGRRYNIAAMRALWNWLTNRIQDNAKNDVVGAGRIIVNSYCLGFVAGIEKIVNASPTIVATSHLAQEAKHYMRLTHYELQTVPPCNNSNIDQIAFAHGQLKGESVNLNQLVNINTQAS
jgi:hypothetical protein